MAFYCRGYIRGTGVNYRLEPGLNNKPLGQLRNGELVTVSDNFAQKDELEWAFVSWSRPHLMDGKGWVATKYIEYIKNI